MSTNPAESIYPHVLHSWRRIAEYMCISERTARRWHERYGLPVVRLVGKRVFTSTGVIDTWVRHIDAIERTVREDLKREAAQQSR